MTTSPEEHPSVIHELWADMRERVSPHIEHIKFLRGHSAHEGWSLSADEDGEDRFQCGCGDWLDDKEAEDDAGDVYGGVADVRE